MYAYAYWSDYSGGKSDITPEKLLDNQKKALLNQAKKSGNGFYTAGKKQELEQALNFFLPGPNSASLLSIETGFTPEEIKLMEDAIKARIEAAISKYNVSGVNWNTLTAISEGGVAALAGGKLEARLRNLTNDSDWNNIKAINRRLEELGKGIQTLSGDLQTDLSTKLKKLKDDWKYLQNNLKKQGALIKTGKNFNFINEVNALTAEFKQQSSSYVTGQIGEMWAAASANLYKQVVENGFEDVAAALRFIGSENFMTGLVGTEKEKHFIDSKKLSSLSYGTDSGGNTITFSGAQGNAKQGKIDFQLSLPDSKKTIYDLSIKNYSDKAEHFTIHSGSSIIMLLQQYGDVLDYFINTLPRKNVPEDKEHNKIVQSPGQNLNISENILKMSLLVQGLMGAYTTQTGAVTDKTADTFVVFRNGKYHIYFISDIINKLVGNINNINNYGTIIDSNTNSNLNFSNLQNVWISKKDDNNNEVYDRSYGLQRTAALLASLQTTKMEMSITLNTLGFT